jgi:predicted transcriptional regulator
MAFISNGSNFSDYHIQLRDWPKSNVIDDFLSEEQEFDTRVSFKTKINEQLEKAKQSKLIGQSLDAKAIIEISSDDDIFRLLKIC